MFTETGGARNRRRRRRRSRGKKSKREMTEISYGRRSSLRLLFFVFSISLQFLSGFSDDSGTKKDTKTGAQAPSKSSTGSTVAIVCLVLVAVVLLSFFLFKVWQKKKREEQYARLLKLFEEDDELELELGLRD